MYDPRKEAWLAERERRDFAMDCAAAWKEMQVAIESGRPDDACSNRGVSDDVNDFILEGP
jgi:hypothetical protein